MKTTDFLTLEGFSVAIQGEEKMVEGVYCADLLSWAISRAPAGSAWCTVMGNVNALAVASLTEVAAVVLCEGATMDDAARNRATTEGICVVCTQLPTFEAGMAIGKAVGLAGV